MQAANTRADILRAARKLFAEKGYAGTSVEDIAREAGVAVQTIYSSVGSKRVVLSQLNDLIDEQAGLDELVPLLSTTRDPDEILRLAVAIPRRFAERCGDIQDALESAAAIEPEAIKVFNEGRRRHMEGDMRIARLLEPHLAPGVSVERAAQLMAILTFTSTWKSLREDYGMSFDEVEDWMMTALRKLLFEAADV